MNTAGISNQAWTPFHPNLDGTVNQRIEQFKAFRTALQSGNLSDAQAAFSAFQKTMQKGLQNLTGGGATAEHAQAAKDLQAIGDALQNGDLQGARQAFVSLKSDIQAAYARHVQPAADAPAPSPSVEPRGEILNAYA